jgi:cytochrome b subunit of formate dehydrogenase
MSTPYDPPVTRGFVRFGLSDRVQHAVMLASFVVLAVTGLPQKYIYANVTFVDDIISFLGGIERVRIVHRVAATVLMLAVVYHAVAVAHRVLVRRARLSMLPRYLDVVHAWQGVRYNLGFARDRPRMDRFTWEEKLEYWSLVWGTVVMVVTGFMLWNPIATARVLPGEFIPTAKVVHGSEALLAVLAVLVWHFYAVHLRSFNRSMFTGRMGEHEMEEEHPLELERIREGTDAPQPDPAALRRRQRLFVPVATVVTLLLLAGIYWFVTFEQTAIATLPPPPP